MVIAAAAVVVIAAVAAFLAIRLSSSPGTPPIPGTRPLVQFAVRRGRKHATASATAGPSRGRQSLWGR